MEEFDVLCKSMAALGPAVRRVISCNDGRSSRKSFFQAEPFSSALPACSGLAELRCASSLQEGLGIARRTNRVVCVTM